ncbi:MAG: class I SAM-dependent methyltransferase [Deltaproteobacteria bacterium]|nr:class I SAM-dependent methyltransferase [Deltaproteobacteria bacterium]
MESPAAKDTVPACYYQQTRPELVKLIEPRGLRILEVGCAQGAMGGALRAAGAAQVVGVDIHEPSLEVARQRLSAAHRVDLNALEPLPYPEGHFDLITFADVLEHLVDPAAVLRHLSRWLRPDGRILISIPNIRHESVVLPLLVEGRWDYADYGILDRTHLRFFTRDGVVKLLADSGFALEGKMMANRSAVPSYLGPALELIEQMGGDPQRFLEECNIVQFVVLARPALAARAGVPHGNGKAAAPRGSTGCWAGARAVRVLLVPDLEEPGDCWAPVLAQLGRELSASAEVTLAVALPAQVLAAPPPQLQALAAAPHSFDLLVTAQPATEKGWEALVGGASLLVLTAAQPELEDMARRLGVEIQDARTPEGPVAATPAAPPAETRTA